MGELTERHARIVPGDLAIGRNDRWNVPHFEEVVTDRLQAVVQLLANPEDFSPRTTEPRGEGHKVPVVGRNAETRRNAFLQKVHGVNGESNVGRVLSRAATGLKDQLKTAQARNLAPLGTAVAGEIAEQADRQKLVLAPAPIENASRLVGGQIVGVYQHGNHGSKALT